MITSTAVAIAESRIGKTGESIYSGRSRAVLQRSYLAFRSSAWIVVLTGFLEPVLYLFSFGYGVGKLIGDIQIAPNHFVSYAAFIAPALLATSAMNGAIYDATWNVFFKMKFDRVYQGMLATSLGPLDVALGEIGWALLRGVVYSIAFMSIVGGLGLITTPWALLAIPAASLIAFGFAAVGMAVTTYLKSFEQMNIINVVLLPMFLFSGSFYPLTVYPGWLQAFIKALPLWHGIILIRSVSLGLISPSLIPHVIYFLIMIVLGLFFTTRRLTNLFMR
jgi:lipooligosaccharide transport system permease protein